MGTSKGYEPPTGGDWNSLKRQIGSLLEQPEEKKKIVISRFVRALGGADNFSSYNKPKNIPVGVGKSSSFKSSTARTTVQNIGSFFSDISQNGLQGATKSRGIDIVGKTIDEVKEAFIDYFLTPAIDSDSACASLAVETVMNNLFDDISDSDDLEEFLSNVINTDKAKELVCGFYENYIYELFARSFFEDRTKNTNQNDAIEILEIVKTAIHEKLATFQCSENIANIDFNSQDGSDFVQGTLKEILEILEEEE